MDGASLGTEKGMLVVEVPRVGDDATPEALISFCGQRHSIRLESPSTNEKGIRFFTNLMKLD